MNDRLTILCGDVLERLRELPDESVQCCVTSPPFWGLRDYGTAKWNGGDDTCDHKAPSRFDYPLNAGLGPTGVQKQDSNVGSGQSAFRDDCGKCGAKRIDAQLGLEKTPEEYVAKMVEVFREVRRVLRKDGTLWLNLGDSYSGSGRCPSKLNPAQEMWNANVPIGLKPKDLIGIPWRVAFALQADGWWLRSDIIWAKPNPMPESVTDRPTKSHEYIFLLTKSAKYFYDAAAIREPASDAMLQQVAEGYNGNSTKLFDMAEAQDASSTKSRIIEGARKKIDKQRGHSCRHAGFNDRWDHLTKEEQQAIGSNKRSVWTVATQPYLEAHFATYPLDLIKPCILAGSKPGDVVLDPFAGSGTTGLASLELGRKATLIELNPKYVTLIEQRTDVTPGLALA